jgi:hypothetical protein
VFICLLSFARAKKVRRLPAATGTTAICGKTLSLQDTLGLQNTRASQTNSLIAVSKKPKINPGVAPPAVALLFLLAQNE